MPLSTAQCDADVRSVWVAADLVIRPEVALHQRSKDISSHSGRRGGLTVARNKAELAGVDFEAVKERVYAHWRWAPEGQVMARRYTGYLERNLRVMITRWL
jgi:hypothetical protein